MKMKYAMPVSVLWLTLGSATLVWAADYGTSPANTPDKAQSPAASSPVTGTVQQVDVDNSSVQIKDTSGNVQTVKVDMTTLISRQGSTIQLAELKIGDMVTIKNANSTM
jgi:hypothetical protein